ncbi:MAG: GHMP kinase [Sporomusaceae bacterium]|nr:GHMP kinase [Sporomusaceae bacterium]
MVVTVAAPGTCGELVQGTIEGRPFLITCPVNVYSHVTVSRGGQTGAAGEKTRLAVARTLAYLGETGAELILRVQSALPVGKGMASSSADIAAACQAAAICCGRRLTADEIADIALAIEPTDGIVYPGIVMFDHLGGLIRRPLGPPPPLLIAVFDAGGEVNTQNFNQRRDLAALNAAKEAQVRRAAELVADGLRQGDCRLIGQGATLSAIANQAILPKPCLEPILEMAARFGAVGVNAAHSGTVLGLLFAPDDRERLAECVATVMSRCPGVAYWRTVELIGGGLTIVEES